jgi:hypothetical protein
VRKEDVLYIKSKTLFKPTPTFKMLADDEVGASGLSRKLRLPCF